MIKRRFVLFSAATALLPALAQEQRAKFDPRREGVADVAAAVLRAASEGKRAIADVGGEWCTWCHLMDQFIAANPDVRAVLEANFVWVKVNYSPSNKNERLLSMWPKITGYPHLFVLDATGKVVRSQPSSELEKGSNYDKSKFLAFLTDSKG